MVAILIVEDDALIREFTELTILDWGYETFSAADVGEALAILKTPHRIDALMTDIRLKAAVHGGYELAKEAIKLRPGLRVLYATGSANTVEAKALFVEGAYYIQKPYTQERLRGSFDRIFETKNLINI